jgi:hypothetical protein
MFDLALPVYPLCSPKQFLLIFCILFPTLRQTFVQIKYPEFSLEGLIFSGGIHWIIIFGSFSFSFRYVCP